MFIICVLGTLLIQVMPIPQIFADESGMEQRILKIETALGINSDTGISIEERLADIEEKMAEAQDSTDPEASGGSLGKIFEWVTLSGAIEVEAGFESSDVNDSDNSDFSLATAELGIEASPREWLTGFMLIKWEDEDDKMIVDEVHITLGSTDEIPYYLSAGKIYVPFNLFETMMISDPITLDMAETVDNAIHVGFEMKGIRSAVYAFNGEAEEALDKSDTIDVFGVSLGYAQASDTFSFDLGADWVNNILESGGFRDVYNNNGWAATLDDQVPGFFTIQTSTLPPEDEFEGHYSGTYSGLFSGTWDATIDNQGNVSGTGSNSGIQGYTFTIGGTVSDNGTIDFYTTSGGTDEHTTFSGTIDEYGIAAGTWTNPYYGASGTFRGAKTN